MYSKTISLPSSILIEYIFGFGTIISFTDRSAKSKTPCISSSSVLSKMPFLLPSSRRIFISPSPICSSRFFKLSPFTTNIVENVRKFTNINNNFDVNSKRGAITRATFSL